MPDLVQPPVAVLERDLRIVLTANGVFAPPEYDYWELNLLAHNMLGAGGGGPSPVATTLVQGITKVDHNSGGDPVALTSAGHGAAADPHTQYALDSEKAQPNGIATLDAGTKVPVAQLPVATTVAKGVGRVDNNSAGVWTFQVVNVSAHNFTA